MALQYSGGPYRNDFYAGPLTRKNLLTSINTSLVASGWTSQNIFAFTVANWTGQPTAAQTVGIGGRTYTWRAAVGATANEVLIGANAQASYENLRNAINLGPGSGTTYGSSTTLNANVTATDQLNTSTAIGSMRLQSKINSTPFGEQGLLSFTSTTSNLTYQYATNLFAGYIWTSPKTPQGQAVRIYGVDANYSLFGADFVLLTVMDETEFYRSNAFLASSGSLGGAQGFCLFVETANFRVICGKYSVLVTQDGAVPGAVGRLFFTAVPYLYPQATPISVVSTSNTTPITVTTATAHFLTTGDTQLLRGDTGNTAANGPAVATVLTPTSYTIPQSGSGVSAGSPVMTCLSVPNLVRCAVALFAVGDRHGSGLMFPWNRLIAENGNIYQNVNGTFFKVNGAGTSVGGATIVVPGVGDTGNQTTTLLNLDVSGVIYEPHFCLSGSTGTKGVWIGQFYDMFISTTNATVGDLATVDSANWYCVGNIPQSIGSRTPGAVWLRIG